jgi:hypothetical protein
MPRGTEEVFGRAEISNHLRGVLNETEELLVAGNNSARNSAEPF